MVIEIYKILVAIDRRNIGAATYNMTCRFNIKIHLDCTISVLYMVMTCLLYPPLNVGQVQCFLYNFCSMSSSNNSINYGVLSDMRFQPLEKV